MWRAFPLGRSIKTHEVCSYHNVRLYDASLHCMSKKEINMRDTLKILVGNIVCKPCEWLVPTSVVWALIPEDGWRYYYKRIVWGKMRVGTVWRWGHELREGCSCE